MASDADVQIVEADLARDGHARSVIALTDAYARDPVGGGRPLLDLHDLAVLPAARGRGCVKRL